MNCLHGKIWKRLRWKSLKQWLKKTNLAQAFWLPNNQYIKIKPRHITGWRALAGTVHKELEMKRKVEEKKKKKKKRWLLCSCEGHPNDRYNELSFEMNSVSDTSWISVHVYKSAYRCQEAATNAEFVPQSQWKTFRTFPQRKKCVWCKIPNQSTSHHNRNLKKYTKPK